VTLFDVTAIIEDNNAERSVTLTPHYIGFTGVDFRYNGKQFSRQWSALREMGINDKLYGKWFGKVLSVGDITIIKRIR
jgi:hypothetical protein